MLTVFLRLGVVPLAASHLCEHDRVDQMLCHIRLAVGMGLVIVGMVMGIRPAQVERLLTQLKRRLHSVWLIELLRLAFPAYPAKIKEYDFEISLWYIEYRTDCLINSLHPWFLNWGLIEMNWIRNEMAVFQLKVLSYCHRACRFH